MNFLVLSPEAVYPANTGGRIGIFNKIKYLKQLRNSVEVICIVNSDEEVQVQESVLSKMGIICHSINRNKKKNFNIIKALFFPYTVASRTYKYIKRLCCQIIKDTKIDYVLAEAPPMLMNIDSKILDNTKVILFQHNIEYVTMRSNGRAQKTFVKRVIYFFESLRMETFEKLLYRKNFLSAVTFVSDADKEFFDNNLNYGKVPTFLLPVGAESHEAVDSESNANNVVIVGKMSYAPNIEGVLWFCNKVWNNIKKSVPDARLYIVGKDPDKCLLNLASDDIIVTGTVDSVDDYYKMSSVAVIPLFSGGGVKTKLIEASSYKIPIVCTTSGVKGTMYKNGEHILVSDDEEQFADLVIDSLKNRKAAHERAERCYGFFMKNYQWNGIMTKFIDEIADL